MTSFWKIRFINPPEVRGRLFETARKDECKIEENEMVVKRILAFAGVKSQAQDREGDHNIWGVP